MKVTYRLWILQRTLKRVSQSWTHYKALVTIGGFSLKFFSLFWFIPYNEGRIPFYRTLGADLKRLRIRGFEELWNLSKVTLSFCLRCSSYPLDVQNQFSWCKILWNSSKNLNQTIQTWRIIIYMLIIFKTLLELNKLWINNK